MDVTLHLGAHRTGTTTFQQIMMQNQSLLQGEGVRFWGPRRTRDGVMSGLIRARGTLTPEIRRRASRSIGHMHHELDRLEGQGVDTLVVSEENLLGGLRANLVTERLYPDAGWRLARAAPAFQDRVTRVLLAIRDYGTWWASALSYAISVGHPAPTQGQLDRMATQPRRWSDVVAEVAGVYPSAKVTVWSFEDLVARPADQIALALGRAPRRAPHFGETWHHRSLSAGELRAVAQAQGGRRDARRIPPGPDRWRPFDDGHLDVMQAAYAADLAWLRNGADGLARFVERGPGLPPDGAAQEGQKDERQDQGLAHAR